jgi:DNA-binding CsgD family transcriptional regulator
MIWKYIEGTNEYYSVSDTGLIRSNSRIITDSLGRKTAYPEKILELQINEFGYSSIKLSSAFRSKRFLVHRLVAQAFIPNPDNKPEVNHIDSNTGNSNVSNLEWVTHKENMEHASTQGRMWTATITEKQQELIKEHSLQKITQNEIARLLNLDPKTVNIYAQKFGVNNPRNISDEIKNKVKLLYESGCSRKFILTNVDINNSTLSKIFIELGLCENFDNKTKKLIKEIQSLSLTGMTQIDISRKLKISKNTVGKYIKVNI